MHKKKLIKQYNYFLIYFLYENISLMQVNREILSILKLNIHVTIGNFINRWKINGNVPACVFITQKPEPLQWRHNGNNCVSNHQPHDCLLNRLFGRRCKKTSKIRITGLWVGNSPGTGEFPAQMASNAENNSSWWCYHDNTVYSRWHLQLAWKHAVTQVTQYIHAWKILGFNRPINEFLASSTLNFHF